MNHRPALRALSLALLVAAGRSANAAVSPAGPAKDVVPCPTCAERSPAIAGTRAGKVVVGWEGATSSDARGVSARSFVSPGQTSGGPIAVNAATEFLAERGLALAATPTGGFVAAWASVDSSGDSDIWVRRFDAAGAPLGAATQVNIQELTQGSVDSSPALGVGADGSFLVAWISSPAPPGSFDRVPVVRVRRYNAAGTPLQAPIVASTSLIDTRTPSVCLDSTGRGIVGWITVDEIRFFQPSPNGVALRRFGATGAAVDSSEKTIASPLADRSEVALACGPAGNFVVAWSTDQAPAALGRGTVAARYDKSGRRLGSVILVAPGAESPSVSQDPAGNFVVAWSSANGGTSRVAGRRYLANGAAEGAAFQVAASTSLTKVLRQARVAHFGAAKAFAIAWDAGGSNVLLRFFKAQ